MMKGKGLRGQGGAKETGSLRIPMEWLRLVGSLKLQVSFAECRLFYMALLQKRPIILRSLVIVATPYRLGASKVRHDSV